MINFCLSLRLCVDCNENFCIAHGWFILFHLRKILTAIEMHIKSFVKESIKATRVRKTNLKLTSKCSRLNF